MIEYLVLFGFLTLFILFVLGGRHLAHEAQARGFEDKTSWNERDVVVVIRDTTTDE